jgi:replicative DNA helicase
MLLTEVEKAVAGMVLREPKNLATALALGVGPDDFTDFQARSVFGAAYDLWREGREIDVASVGRVRPNVAAEAAQFRRDAPRTQNFEPYAQALLDHRRQTEVMARLGEISHRLTNRRVMDPLGPTLEELARLIAYCRGGEKAARAVTVSEALAESLAEAEERLTAKSGLGVPTGIKNLDRVLGGFQKGSVYILGARTAVGKTTMAVNMALSASEAGKRVGFVTVEMSGVDIVNKMISRSGRITSGAYLSGNLSDAEVDRLHQATNVLGPLPITFVEVMRPTVDTLEIEAMRLEAEGIDLLIIDYLQLFEAGDGKHRTPREESKIVSTRIKMLARSLNLPVLVLSQLNRQAPDFGEPELVHIAESDQIARDADVVMFLFRLSAEGNHCLSVAKNRRGRKVAVQLRAELEFSNFTQAPNER